MKKEEIILLGLSGVAVVLALRAAGFKMPALTLGASTGTGTFRKYNPFYSVPGQAINPANPGAYIPVNDLVNGTVTDFYNGGDSSYDTPSINAIFTDVLRETYGTSSPGSVIRRTDGYW